MTLPPSPRRPGSDERGLYLILIAFFLFVLVALCALVIGLGFLSTNKTRIQNIANVTSIAALESFVQNRNPLGTPAPYATRVLQAVDRANEIVEENRNLPGMALSLGNLAAGSVGGRGGKVVFGMWYPEQISGNPCGADPADYPCFIPNVESPPSDAPANAVRVELKSQPENPLILPFANLLGIGGKDISTSSIARLVQRCVVFILDASISTVQETHVSTDYKIDSLEPPNTPHCRPPDVYASGTCGPAAQNTFYPTPGLVIYTPHPVSMFAYITDNLAPLQSLTPPPAPTPHPCQNIGNFVYDEFAYYCNMPPRRNGLASSGESDKRHFRSDYLKNASPYGTVAVDSFYDGMDRYHGPQPLSRFFLAFNAGVRAVQQVRSPGDKAMVYVFQGDALDTEPVRNPVTGQYQLAENMNMMVQLTNVLNRGMVDRNGTPVPYIPVVTPNFVTRGWFPYAASNTDIVGSTSNHAKALWDAIAALSECPDSARRVIIMASDGIPTCAFNRLGAATPEPDGEVDCVPPTVAGGGFAPDYYGNYLAAEAAILGTIKDELVRRGISVTTLLDSEAVDPNFINVTIAPGLTPTPSSIWVNPEDAAKYGFCGTGSGGCPPFFNVNPEVGDPDDYTAWVSSGTGCSSGSPATECSPDHYAFRFASVPQRGVKFRRPNGLWGQLALETGGVVCPLFPKCTPSWYASATPPALIPTYRAGMSEMRCAPLNQSKAEQAINCVLAAVGIDPYQNVEEIPEVSPPN